MKRTNWYIHRRTVRWWAAYHSGPEFHAMLCDPPYHLTSITKRFGGADSAPAQFGTDGAFARASRGFMGKQWDGGNVAFNPDTWAALATHLYPGAFGMAFASSRGWHRMAVAIEDAGLIIHPSIFGWSFGSGFPKATRVPDERFNGHRYGLQALKPALEPIIVFQKPYQGRPIDNIVETGAGALNIDGARLGTERVGWAVQPSRGYSGGLDSPEDGGRPVNGRWPANLVLDTEAARRLDAQSGVLTSGTGSFKRASSADGGYAPGVYGKESRPEGTPNITYGDSGGASRFFFNYQHDALDSADPLYYCAKADKSEREAGLKGYDVKPAGAVKREDGGMDGAIPYRANTHPTVKPIDLTRWLATLLLPPAAYGPRRILIPFSGSGSEMIGAMQAGWESITGIEMAREYAAIAEARMAFWSLMGTQRQLDLFAA
jgi:hypothetical protein